jgi:hypothetical protein
MLSQGKNFLFAYAQTVQDRLNFKTHLQRFQIHLLNFVENFSGPTLDTTKEQKVS